VTAEAVIAALNLPTGARVDLRVPKKLLLENGSPTAADKRLINEGIEEIRWLAALKPTTCGVPEYRNAVREYLEIAVLHVVLREQAKADRLIELMHRAVPYPVLLLIDDGDGDGVRLSLSHKRHALKEADKVVLDGEPLGAHLRPEGSEIQAAFLQALDVARQPRATLYVLYQGWLDTVLAFQAALITGNFALYDVAERAAVRRRALHAVIELQSRITGLRSAAAKASQMARQVDINLQLKKLESELTRVKGEL
jgi:hypothetical protein